MTEKLEVYQCEVCGNMEEKHFIEWIELVADGKAYRQFLNPGETPQAFFALEAEKITARAFCNLHGMWKSS